MRSGLNWFREIVTFVTPPKIGVELGGVGVRRELPGLRRKVKKFEKDGPPLKSELGKIKLFKSILHKISKKIIFLLF